MARQRCFLLALLGLASSACEVRDGERPSLTIVSPEDGAEHASSSIDVVVDIDRFTLDTATFPVEDETQSQPFHGHWHLYMADLLNDSEFTFVGDQFTESALLTDLASGTTWIVAAELVNQNHIRVHGTPIAFAEVDVPLGSPALEIERPADGFSLNSSSAEVEVDVDGFTLDEDAIGAPNVAGSGHYHVEVGAIDGILEADSAAEITRITDLVTGSQSVGGLPITVELVNNDHTPLVPAVKDVTAISIPSSAPRMSIVAPVANATVGTDIGFTLAVDQFQLVDFTSVIADTAGQGHYHVLVDGVDVGHDWEESAGGFIAAPGSHEVVVELRSNLHEPLLPPVVDTVRVTAE